LMFLFERETDEAVVLLSGVPESWISSDPVGFKNMPTYCGRLSCTIERAKNGSDRLVAHIAGTCPVPSGGIRLTNPLALKTKATVNGKAAEIDSDARVVVRELPAAIELHVTQSDVR